MARQETTRWMNKHFPTRDGVEYTNTLLIVTIGVLDGLHIVSQSYFYPVSQTRFRLLNEIRYYDSACYISYVLNLGAVIITAMV